MDAVVHRRPTTPALVLRALRRHPSRVAFSWDSGVLTYAGARAQIGAMQAALANLGLAPGQRLGVLGGNVAASWCATLAAQASGLSTTPLHPLGSLDDHCFQIEDAECDALLVDPACFPERGGELAAASGVGKVLTLGRAGYGIDLLAAAERAGACRPRDLSDPDGVAILNYTSGTSGRPKAALRRHRTLAGSTASILADFDLPPDPRYLAVAPISHVAGSKIGPVLLRGGTVHLQHGFDPGGLVAAIAEHRLTMTLLVPTMIYALLDTDLDGADLSSLELVLYGAAAMSPSRLVEALERIGPVFAQLYGQTEAYPLSILRREDHDPAHPELFSSCGVAVSSADVRLLDDDGVEVAVGGPGELCCRSPYVMDEYWKQPELTAETLRDGWLRTGDVAVTDERGYLFIVDRKKDMIVTGGFNVFSREVEDVLTSHPGVAAAAVIGVPHRHWGEAVHAVVALRPDAIVAEAELITLVKERKGSVFAPKTVEFRASLPVTGLGKVDKKVLREPHWQDRQRAVN